MYNQRGTAPRMNALATLTMHIKSTVNRHFQIARTYPAFASDEAQMLLDELRDDLVKDLLKQPTSNVTNPAKNEEVPNLPSESPAHLIQMHGRSTSMLDASQVQYALSHPEPRTPPRQTSGGNRIMHIYISTLSCPDINKTNNALKHKYLEDRKSVQPAFQSESKVNRPSPATRSTSPETREKNNSKAALCTSMVEPAQVVTALSNGEGSSDTGNITLKVSRYSSNRKSMRYPLFLETVHLSNYIITNNPYIQWTPRLSGMLSQKTTVRSIDLTSH